MPATTRVSTVIAHSADAVWATIEDFGDYRWGEGVGAATVEGERDRPGAVRTFRYYDATSRQRLVAYDAAARTMTWQSVEAFDPTLRHYAATIAITPITALDASFVEWSVSFDASEDAEAHWRAHQEREFLKSLERLALYVGWRERGLLKS